MLAYVFERERTTAQWRVVPFFEIAHFRTRFANERGGRLGTRSSRYLWKYGKICREHVFSSEVISGFPRRTRRDKAPTPTAPTPLAF